MLKERFPCTWLGVDPDRTHGSAAPMVIIICYPHSRSDLPVPDFSCVPILKSVGQNRRIRPRQRFGENSCTHPSRARFRYARSRGSNASPEGFCSSWEESCGSSKEGRSGGRLHDLEG